MTTTPRTPSHPLLARLDDEWARLRTSRPALTTARGWARACPGHPLAAIAACITDLDEFRLATQRSSDATRPDDAILLALVALARDDELAGRVVLQRLLPGLISQAMRYRSFSERDDPISQVVPAAWLAIRAYDTTRRTRHVAASLISDAVFQAFRRRLRTRASSEEVWAPDDFVSILVHDGPRTPLDEFVSVLREARRAGVPARDLDLLRQLVRVGSPGEVARQRDVTARTIRNHRDRAVDHVRAAFADAA